MATPLADRDAQQRRGQRRVARQLGGRDAAAERALRHGRIGTQIDAERARPDGNGWLLENVSIYDSAMNAVLKRPSMRALEGVEPQRFTLAKVDPDAQNFGMLSDNIAEMKQAGVSTAEAETGLFHKVSQPLSTVLMPLLAAMAAFGLARSGKVLLRAAIAMALGFAYFVVDNFAVALGNIGAYPPLVAAWAPFLLFLLIGETVLVRSEE